MAQSLQELLVAVINNPMSAQILDIDPRSLMNEIQYLRGTGNVSRFSLQKQVASGAPPLPMAPEMMPQAMPQQPPGKAA
jgi:hypothetical protein